MDPDAAGGGGPARPTSPTAPPRPAEARDAVIDRLAAAAVSTARGVQGQWFYVGWTADGLPAAGTGQEDLSRSAMDELGSFRASRLQPRRLPFASLIPVRYLATGAAVDFADAEGRRAEDQVKLTVEDAAGQQREISLGEIALLGGIAAARDPWQAHPQGALSELAVGTVPIYTVFTSLPGLRADTGLALLFQSTLPGHGNEATFRGFVRNVIGRLLILDESAPPKARKGYLERAGRLAGVAPTGGYLHTLVKLRDAGLVTFPDDWLRAQQSRGGRLKGGFLRALRGVGMVEVTDEQLAQIADSRPDYDVDGLELGRMLDLAAAMLEAVLEGSSR